MSVPAKSYAAEPAPGSPPARRRYASLAVAVLFMAGAFALRLAVESPAENVLMLYVLPIALVALEWGTIAGLVAALASFGLFVAWVEIEDVEVDALAYAVRAAAYFPIAALVGVGAQRLREGRRRESRYEARQRAILDTANEAFIAVDREGSIIQWNSAAERTFGWRADEVVGRRLADTVVPPRMRAGFWRGMRDFFERGEGPLLGQRVEIAAIRKDGTEIPIELSLSAVAEEGDWTFHGFMHDISERKESERRLQQAARYFELSHDLVCTGTPDGYLEQLNRRWQSTLGWSPEELRGRPYIEFVHPDDRETTERENARLIERGTSLEFRNRFRAKDGSWRWLEWSTVLVPEEQRVYAAARDVTARIEAEVASRRLSAIVESSRDPIYGYTLDGEIVTWNAAAERLFGYTASEAIGMSLAQLVPPDQPDDTPAILARIAAGEVVEDRETVRMAKDGRHLELSLTVSPIRDDEGAVIAAAVIARDISDRRRTQRYLSAQYRTTSMLSELPEVAGLGARVLPILADSARWTAALYWAAPEGDEGEFRCEATWVAAHLRGPVLPVQRGLTCEAGADWDHGSHPEPAWIDIASDSPIPIAGRLARTGMKTALWAPLVAAGRLRGGFEFVAREHRDPDEELLGVVGSVVSQIDNYVERRIAEQESERAKSEFFSLISHELRTPLTSIIGYTELLAETETEALSEQGRDFLEVVDRNARRELRLVADMLLLARIEAGTFAIEPEQADLREIVNDAVESARPTAEQQNVTLSSQIEPVPELRADPARMGQVVDNLLTNAIKFSPDGGEVTVQLSSEDDQAVIEVSDTGIGIPPDEKERLFERLYRARGATDLRIPGTGLGLTIVKAIVDAHGGRIDVDSTEGVGTSFRIGLPLGRSSEREREEAKEAST